MPISAGSTIGRDPTVEDIATLLFVESLTPTLSRFVPRGVSITNLVTASGYPSASKDSDDKGKVYRTLASTWIESRTDPGDMYQALSGTLRTSETTKRAPVAGRTAPTRQIEPRGPPS